MATHTPAGQTPAGKICRICKRDCSAMKRVKDRAGNYVCQGCVDARAASAGNSEAVPVDDGVIPIDLDGVTLPGTNEMCPGCGMPISSNAVVCLSCGFNQKKGKFTAEELAEAQDPEKPRKKKKYSCAKCGYSLEGLKTAKCPECGTINSRETGKLNRDGLSKQIVRDAYMLPLIYGGVGLVLTTVALLVNGAGLAGVIFAFAALLVGAIFSTGVYFMFCLMWSGFEMPMHMAAMRLFATFAVSWGVEILAKSWLVWPAAWAISTIVTYGTLMKLMEIDDWKEAVLLLFVLRITGFVAVIVTLMLLARGLGMTLP